MHETLELLALACRILEAEGHGDMTLGHLSVRDPGGRGFWMKRNRAALGEIRGPEDFVLVSWSGEKLEGQGGRHSEWPIHSEVLKLRPDVQVVAHTHPLHASVFSGGTEALLPYTLDADYFADLPRHEDDVALVTTVQEGEALARSLGPHFAVLMANHGVTFCGTSVEHATCVGVFLEKACRAHLLGKAAGLPLHPVAPEVRARRHAQIMTATHVTHSWDYFRRVHG